ncbi:DUF6252 family protein [uncultured Psychroserpens sp.]|uniref:DUF6252 family protein n=1 Tax=uncultured Psychroserpens sp. TaxID=255436 RepID=UPI0026016DBF|nr:DUF6252 family protein [uncultured Psychroserpens sp.]
MKNLFQILTVICFSLVLVNCSSDDSSNPPSTQEQLTINVNGTQYTASAIMAAMGNDNKYFELDSANSDGTEGLQLRIGDFNESLSPVLEAGMTYNWNGTDDTTIFYQNTQSVYGGTNGCQITITSINFEDNTISGTFSGVVSDGNTVDDQTLTNGVFNNIPFSIN